MKQPQKLEIIRYLPSGEIYKRIVCLAGSVSVLRSTDETLLEVYSNSLAGKPVEQELSMLLDGVECDTSIFSLIGYQELSTEARSVAQFLVDSGFDRSSIGREMEKYGLGGLEQVPGSELSAAQWRIAQIMASWWNWTAVTVLFDPFRDLPSKIIEPLAARTAKAAWDSRSIVVVPVLRIRPEAWVENELIRRLSLEKARKNTVGVGNADDVEFMDAVNNIRQALQPSTLIERNRIADLIDDEDEQLGDSTIKEALKTVPAVLFKSRFHWRRVQRSTMVACYVFIGLFVCFLFVVSNKSGDPNLTEVGTIPIKPPTIALIETPIQQVNNTPQNRLEKLEVTVPTVVASPEEPKKLPIVDTFPAEIRDAVRASFSEPVKVEQDYLKKVSDLVAKPTVQPAKTSELIEPNTLFQHSVASVAEVEQQRDLLRQSYQEAMAEYARRVEFQPETFEE